MSLILDALRKAEAERQRGQVPGLHGAAAPSLPERAADAAPRRAAQALAGLGVLAAAGAVAWWAWPASAPPAGVVAAPEATPAAPPAPAPLAAPVPALPVVVSAPPAPAPAAAMAEPVRAAAAPPLPTAAAAPPPAPIVTQVRRLAELAPEQRRELPPLAVSGSVWSEQPGARFVVLDGQVLREGDSLQPGLVLVKLAPRSATLRWRDTLVEVPY